MKFRMFKQLRSIFIIVSLIIVMFESTLVYAESLSNKDVGWSNIAVGVVHSLGVKEDGTVWSWGGNLDGVLGNGKETTMESTKQHPEGEVVENNDQTIPVQINGRTIFESLTSLTAMFFCLRKTNSIGKAEPRITT